jgi:hypothetical protein
MASNSEFASDCLAVAAFQFFNGFPGKEIQLSLGSIAFYLSIPLLFICSILRTPF